MGEQGEDGEVDHLGDFSCADDAYTKDFLGSVRHCEATLWIYEFLAELPLLGKRIIQDIRST